MSDPKKKGHDTVEITRIQRLSDGKSVLLELADLRPVDQMQIDFDIKASDGTAIKQQIEHTIHAVP